MDAAQFIERHEGRVDRPYQCPAGKWTVGVGRNIEARPLATDEMLAVMARGIPQVAIDLMRDHDVERARTEMTACFPSFTGWPPARQAAVMSMVYTLGLGGFLAFPRMVSALRDGRWADAAAEALDSERARQLPRRSEEEAEMIRRGEWLT